jgi:hypothetical protein
MRTGTKFLTPAERRAFIRGFVDSYTTTAAAQTTIRVEANRPTPLVGRSSESAMICLFMLIST